MKSKLTRTIGFKIIFFYILLALINISFIISIIFENQVELISRNSKLEAERQISNLISTVKQFSSEMKKGTLFTVGQERKPREDFIELIGPYASSFFITTEDNRVVYRSGTAAAPPPTMGEDVLRSLTVKNFSGKEYYLRIDDARKMLYCYIPLDDYRMGKTVLVILKDISSLNESLRHLYLQAVYVVIVALFFHAIFALILFRYIIAPLRLLRQGALKLAEGDYGARIDLAERSDEFGSVAESFNTMADSISRNITALSGKAKKAIETRNRADALTVRDELTGLYSRMYLIERINEELTKTHITKAASALLIIGIDDFSNFTRIYGSNSANIIVLEVSKLVRRNCRETDVIARFSDEHIAVLTVDTTIERAKELSEKIRREIESATVVTPDGKFPVTACVGLAFMDFGTGEQIEEGNDLIISAGTALALAREKGKNRIEIFP